MLSSLMMPMVNPSVIALLSIAAPALLACVSSLHDAKARISTAAKAKVGRVVVDAQGRTLYRFTAEAQGRPVCTGACLRTWLPATASSTAGLPAHAATVR